MDCIRLSSCPRKQTALQLADHSPFAIHHSLLRLQILAFFRFSRVLVCLFAFSHAQLYAGTWPTFHGDHALTGFADVTIPDKPRLLWRYSADSNITATPVADASHIYFASEKGTVYALTLMGEKNWSTSLASTNESDSVRVIAPLTVIEGSVVAATHQGRVLRLKAATGDIVWTHDTEEPISSAATWYKPEGRPGRVIVLNQSSGRLSALDAETADVIWEMAGVERADGHLTLANGKLIFGSCAAAIHTVSPVDGSAGVPIPLGDGAEIAGGVAVAGSRAFAGNRSGAIVAVDVNANTSIWVNTEWSGELFTTPAVHEQRVVVANGEGNIVCIDANTGKKQWIYEISARDARSPVIAGNKVVVALDGTLYVLRLDNGKKIWSFDISDEITSPAIVNRTIVVGTDEGQVVCFGE